MGYLVYNPTTRLTDSAYLTLAFAQARANEDADLSVHDMDIVIPEWFIPKVSHFSTGNQIVQDLPFSELEQVKVAIRGCHNQLLIWSDILTEASLTHSASDAAIGHDVLFRGHEGLYLNMHKTDITVPNKILICQQSSIGASDVTNAEEFFQHVHEIRNTPITGPVAWVDEDGMRQEFEHIPGSTMNYFENLTPPEASVLDGGGWIDTFVLPVAP